MEAWAIVMSSRMPRRLKIMPARRRPLRSILAAMSRLRNETSSEAVPERWAKSEKKTARSALMVRVIKVAMTATVVLRLRPWER